MVALDFVFNQEFGILITSDSEKFYLDMDIFNSQKFVDLYLIFLNDKVYISVEGITFNDIIYS
jgi:hypothetical protein